MALKSTVVCKPTTCEFPRLMRRKSDGLTVLFTNKKVGMVVGLIPANSPHHQIGYHSEMWNLDRENWEDVQSVTITTEN